MWILSRLPAAKVMQKTSEELTMLRNEVEMLCAEFEVLKKDHGIGIGELKRKE
jgi:hypothetical protein